MPNLVFLEGPAYAGKTTYLQTYDAANTLKLPEASDFLGGDANFPDAPNDLASMIYCSYFFGLVERERLKHIDESPENPETILADRFTPLSSMLFYRLRHREGAISSEDYEIGIQASSKMFNDMLHLPQAPLRYKFLLFVVTTESAFLARLSRGTRNQEFNDWKNFQDLVDDYRKLLPNAQEVRNGVAPAEEDHWSEDSRGLAALLEPENFLRPGQQMKRLDPGVIQATIEEHLPPAAKLQIEHRIKELLR